MKSWAFFVTNFHLILLKIPLSPALFQMIRISLSTNVSLMSIFPDLICHIKWTWAEENLRFFNATVIAEVHGYCVSC